MVTRRARPLSAAAVLLALAMGWSCAPPASALATGERFPARAHRETAGVEVVWVLRPDDYLTCQNAANGIRQLRRAYPGVPFTVVQVGPHADWLRGFLARQRIAAPVLEMSEKDFTAAFRRRPNAWLYLLRGGRVAAVLPGRGVVYPAASWAPLIGTRAAETRRTGTKSGAGAPST